MDFNKEEVLKELGNPDFDVLDDNTVDRVIDEEQTFYGTVARCARILSNYFALQADKSIGDVSLDYQDRAEKWKEIADKYEAKNSLNVRPFFGGADYKKSDFRRGQFERDDIGYDELQGRI